MMLTNISYEWLANKRDYNSKIGGIAGLATTAALTIDENKTKKMFYYVWLLQIYACYIWCRDKKKGIRW